MLKNAAQVGQARTVTDLFVNQNAKMEAHVLVLINAAAYWDLLGTGAMIN